MNGFTLNNINYTTLLRILLFPWLQIIVQTLFACITHNSLLTVSNLELLVHYRKYHRNIEFYYLNHSDYCSRIFVVTSISDVRYAKYEFTI